MTKNAAAGFFALVLGAAYLIASFRLPEVTAGDEIGPKLFPIIIGVIVMLSGGALATAKRPPKKCRAIPRRPRAHRWPRASSFPLLAFPLPTMPKKKESLHYVQTLCQGQASLT